MITEIAKFVHLKKLSENFYNGLAGFSRYCTRQAQHRRALGRSMAHAQSFRQKGFGFIEKQVFSKRTEIHPIFKKKKV